MPKYNMKRNMILDFYINKFTFVIQQQYVYV